MGPMVRKALVIMGQQWIERVRRLVRELEVTKPQQWLSV